MKPVGWMTTGTQGKGGILKRLSRIGGHTRSVFRLKSAKVRFRMVGNRS
jgi:hypothetical protein